MRMFDFTTIIGAVVGIIVMAIVFIKSIRKVEMEEEGQKKKRDDDIRKLELNMGLGAAYLPKIYYELSDYYSINKKQAIISFRTALFISIWGFIIFAFGIALSFFDKSNTTIINLSTFGGAITEIIAGLFFWIYNKATNQINIFYRSLLDTERLFVAIQLVENSIKEDQKDESYKTIITKILEINGNKSKP